MKDSTVNKLTLLAFLGVIVALIWVGLMLVDERTSCVSNPLVYGVNKISDDNGKDLMCTCNFFEPQTPTITVTRESMSVEPAPPLHVGYSNDFEDINFTELFG